MRLIIFADVHGNWDGLLALQRAEPQPDAVVFLGDAVGFGPEPGPCIDWLRSNAAHAVRGDCDDLAIGGSGLAESESLAREAEATIALAQRTLSGRQRAALALWPVTTTFPARAGRFFLAHGTPEDPLRGRLDLLTAPEAKLREAAATAQADFVCLAGTHIPALRKLDGTLFVNPGSLGQPRYGTPDPTYAVWTDGDVQIRHLHYAPDPVCQKLALLPLDPDVLGRLTETLKTGLA